MKYLKTQSEKTRKKFRLKQHLLNKIRKEAKRQNLSQTTIINAILEEYYKNIFTLQDIFIYSILKKVV